MMTVCKEWANKVATLQEKIHIDFAKNLYESHYTVRGKEDLEMYLVCYVYTSLRSRYK